MLRNLVDFTLRYRYAVLALAGLLCILGLVALFDLPFDAFPDTTPVMVQVNVGAPGWAPEDLERLVTYPLEQTLTGLSSLEELRSVTKYGLCQVTVIFEDGTDLYLARQQVSERLLAANLPEGIPAPQLGPVSTGLGEVFHYIVVSDSEDPTDARTNQDWLLKPQLLAVPGVAEINSWGGFERQYVILFDPDKLARYDLSLDDIVNSLRDDLGNVPGGQVSRGGEMTILRGIGTVESREEIEEIVIATIENTPITVRQIAEVVIGHQNRLGAATYNGQGEAVLGLGFMITGENPAEVTEQLASRLEQSLESLPEGVRAIPVYQRTELVDKVLRTVENNLLFGALLVIAVLFMFLGSFRAGLIVASAIPLSMLFAFDLMSRVGIAGSLMSLGAIDFGMAVDNAVIQMENSVRRLQESLGSRTRLEVIRDAILEVRKPTLFGEIIIILVYLPILTLQGVEGKLFRPMAYTVVFVLTGSMIVSWTVLPALIGAFVKRRKKTREPFFVSWLQKIYRPILERVLRYRRTVLVSALALLLGGLALFMRLGSEFVPRLSEGTIAINFVRLAGISLEESVRYNTQIESYLLEEFPDEIDHLWSRTGSAELSTDPMGLELSDLFISLKPRSEWTKASSQAELVSLIDSSLSDLPGQKRIFTQPIEMRINEMIAGIRSDIGIKIFGDDLILLEDLADEVLALTESIEGSADVAVEQLTGQPQLRLEVDRQRLSRFGLSARDVLSAIESVGGITVGDVFEGQRRFELVMRIDTTRLAGFEDIGRVTIRSPQGGLVGLDRVTRPILESGPASITREWSKRRIVVQCNVRDRDIGSFVSELQRRLDNEIQLPVGYFMRLGGQFENMQRAQARLAIVVPIALLLIFALLYWSYRSTRDAVLIFTGVPMAALGGVVSLAVRGLPFSISAGIGFIALSGIAVLNGLVLVSSIKRMLADGREFMDAVRESAVTRLRPVFATAMVAALGFVPMAISTGVGAEVQRPLATVVVGGILTSTALTLLVLPALYATFGRRTKSEV